MRTSIVSFIVLLGFCVHCSTEGGGSANDTGSGGSGGAGGASGGAGSGAAGPASSPEELAAATCAARSTCDYGSSCEDEFSCVFHLFRSELHSALEACLSDDCTDLDVCFLVATESDNPATYASFSSACFEKRDACPGMGDDWCTYNFFEESEYSEMELCFDLPCDEVNDCVRTIVFVDAPQCMDF